MWVTEIRHTSAPQGAREMGRYLYIVYTPYGGAFLSHVPLYIELYIIYILIFCFRKCFVVTTFNKLIIKQ